MKSPRWTVSEMKEVLLALLELLWGSLFLFPGNVFDIQDRYYFHAFYAQDWFWGIFLLIVSSLTLFSSRTKWLYLRKYLHFLSWFFWLGIFSLSLSRSMESGLDVVDILVVSPYMVIALLHVTLYARLMGAR